jgi:hypothetical protein
MEKSANKRWKESGTSLSFKEWIDRENKKKEAKANFLPFDADINSQLKDSLNNEVISEVRAGYKPTAENRKVFGLDKGVVIFSGILIAGSLGIYFYKRLKAKK